MRSLVLQEMKSRGLNITSLSDKTSINRGSLSAVLNGRKALSVDYIDRITTALGAEEGWLYNQYIEESFRDGGKLTRIRLEPLMMRCAELGKRDCIERVFDLLSEHGDTFLPIMYDVADKLQKDNNASGEALMYEYIIKYDYDYLSDNLIYAHYRMFRLSIGRNATQDLKSIIKFEPFLDKLPDAVQLDAILTIINLYYFHEKWKESERYSVKLTAVAERFIEARKTSQLSAEDRKPERPLIYYYGFGYLAQSSNLQKMGKYNKARLLVAGYADLSAFPIIEKKTKYEIERFKLWAIGNQRTLDLLLGNESALPDYIQFIRDNSEEEILPGLTNLSEAAVAHNYSITPVLKEFEIKVLSVKLETPADKSHFYMIMHNLAVYYINREMYKDGINCAIRGLSIAVKMDNNDFFRQIVTLFERNRNHATQEQQDSFLLALEGGDLNEKTNRRGVVRGSTVRRPAIC